MAEPLAGAFDPRISLATGMHAQPGVYALLLGSGVSTGAGVPTGWGVVTELVRQAAAADGVETPQDHFDPERWWADHGDGRPLGYSSLLETLAPTPGARRGLLASFFEPNEEEREQGLKTPSKAHQAIAGLVARGAVRVILTTNFDRLIEQALEAAGVMPQVIATPAAVVGMEPLPHARCTVVKLHGDYATLDQLNTVEELTTYDPQTVGLLRRVLDEYGLVTCGWSGEWDHALTAALEETKVRRYPLYWATYGELGDVGKRLVAQHRAQVISAGTADQFFTDLLGRLEALDTLADPPLTRTMAVAQLKRYLPDPTKHILLRDLLDAQVGRIRRHLAGRPRTAASVEPAALEDAHETLRREADTLLHLLAQGVYLDRDQRHTDLWVWVVEQLVRARTQPDGQFQEWVDDLQHYPALLAMRTAALAAVAAHRDDLLLRILRKPTWRNRFANNPEMPALQALHDYRVLNHNAVNAFPRWGGTSWLYPRSHLLRETLSPVLQPLVGDAESYKQLCSRTEYRIALAQTLFGDRAAPGEFIGERQWDSEDVLVWETDFRAHGERDAWGWGPVEDGEADAFDAKVREMSDELGKSRRYRL